LTGAPEWARDLIAWDRYAIATDPDGREWEVEARPTGVPRLFGRNEVFWILGWAAHVLVYRLHWNVFIGELRPRPRWKAKKWLYQRYRSQNEARVAMPEIVRRIETGSWRPTDELGAK
jgi:hypothetical protein